MNDRNGLLARLDRWVSGGPQPGLRQPCVLVVGDVDAAVVGVAHLAQASIRTLGDVASPGGQEAGDLVDREIDAGCDLLLLAAPAVRPVSALVAVAAFSGEEPVSVLGFDSRMPDAEWIRRMIAVRDGVAEIDLVQERAEVEGLLADPALTSAAAALERAARRRIPTVLDGPGALAAAMMVSRYGELDPNLCLSAGVDSRPVVTVAARVLGLTAVLDLGQPTGDGVAALLTLPLLRAARLLPTG